MADHPSNPNLLPADAEAIVTRLLGQDRRVLLFGPPGVGKTTLAAALGRRLAAAGRECACLGADPGSPGFGPPGAVCLGRWQDGGWRLLAFEALCSLDAGRFRLPLVAAVRRLIPESLPGTLLLDGPGVVRGVAGAELLAGLVEAAGIDTVLALTRPGRPPPLQAELRALGLPCHAVAAAPAARRPGRQARARSRTRLWDDYLSEDLEQTLALDGLTVLGTPPPREVPAAWGGRQVALLASGRSLAMGEVLALEGEHLRLVAPRPGRPPEALLIRDAQRGADGLLGTAEPFAPERLTYLPPPDLAPRTPAPGGPRLTGRVGMLSVSLVNGVFGDPMLHLRLRHQARSLLFDLGEGARLPAKVAHQVSEVFISHAHMDHIGGFLWLLRSRIGPFPACRIYGPPGMAEHIEGLVRGILWDRVAERAPVFEVGELHGETLQRFRVEAGRRGPQPLAPTPAPDGLLLQEPGFSVRAATLDHGGTPVLAFAFQPARQINIRKERLLARDLPPGPWLAELKQRLLEGALEAPIRLPDGETQAAGPLGADLALIQPGKTLVYATDLADTPDNRARLTALARGAHTFFCEAAFREEHADLAARTGHLTTRACGEIAEAAGVSRLVPFHFSRRYEHDPEPVYAELQEYCGRVVVPETGMFGGGRG